MNDRRVLRNLPQQHQDIPPPARVALVHDYLVHVRGGERVFAVLAEIYPQADLYTLVYDDVGMAPLQNQLAGRKVHTSLVQKLPRHSQSFRAYLPLYPIAARTLDLRGFDLVISSSSAWVHAARVNPAATHICYCHSPFRYAWSHYSELIARNPWRAPLLRPLLALIRQLDRRASAFVDAYVANSEVVRERILTCYGRASTVIHPPVDLGRFQISTATDDYYLVVSALMPYKRVDIPIQACNRLGLPLKIVGEGPEFGRLRALAGPTIEFLGTRPDDEVARLYARCRALVFPTLEDFGIVPLEAMASGRPVIAYGAGGALETITEGKTGRFFSKQTAESLAEVILASQNDSYSPEMIRAHAETFGNGSFKRSIKAFVVQTTEQKRATEFARKW